MKIRNEIKDLLEELKYIRRKLHMFPEIGFNTSNTMKLIKEFVGIEPVEDDGISGVFYLPSIGDCIAFRCELDALNIKEENQFYFKSTNNYMHACGHDLHMAIMILLIRYYIKHEHHPSLLFIFQPAEESGAGALHMIQKNIFEKYKIQQLYAFHVLPELGDFIGCRNNLIMSESCEINIKINGKGGHITSIDSIDAIKATNQFLKEWYRLEKEVKPHKIYIGTIKGGQVCNSIADNCELHGTIRCLDMNIMNSIKDTIQNIIERIDYKYKTTSKLEYSIGYPGLVNNNDLVEKIKYLSGDSYIEIEPLLLSEDFSYYGQYCPICYFFCGLTSDIGLHSTNFNLYEEECLKVMELYIRLIESCVF